MMTNQIHTGSSGNNSNHTDADAKLIDFLEAAESVQANHGDGKDYDSQSIDNIESRMSSLDTDLTLFRSELDAINRSVEEGLDRLSDNDADLTAKVSESYRRLAEIDNVYKSLSAISARIDKEINGLDGDVSQAVKKASSEARSLDESIQDRTVLNQGNQFAYRNERLVEKINSLVESSEQNKQLFDNKLQLNTERLMQLEKNLVADIEKLSGMGKEQVAALDNKIEHHRASILKLQHVDEAIVKRATSLEISSAQLSEKAEMLGSSTARLQASVTELTDEVNTLKFKIGVLESHHKKQARQIEDLGQETGNLGSRVTALFKREENHFKAVTASALLLLLAVAVMYFSQQSQFDVMNIQMADAQLGTEKSALNLGNKLAELEQQVAGIKDDTLLQVNTAITAIKSEQVSVNDRLDSVDGRLTAESSFSTIGSDNVIHGQNWLASQPATNYAIQVAYLEDKQEMYELAQQYNHDLTDELSYFVIKQEGSTKYVLLSGNYASKEKAQRAKQALPGYIGMKRPVIRSIELVKQHLPEEIRTHKL